MKRSKTIVAVTMIMMLSLLITGCGCSLFGKKVSKEDAAIMVGMWDLSNVTIDGKQTTAKELGISMSFEFYDDGTTKYTYNGKSEVYDWKKKAVAIIIYVPDKTNSSKKEEHTAIVNGDSMKLDWEIDGKPVEMGFDKTSSTVSTDKKGDKPTNDKNTDPTANQNTTNTTNNTTQNNDSADRELLIGKWDIISVSTDGQTYTGGDVSGVVEFRKDGTVVVEGLEEQQNGTWELSDGVVTFIINEAKGVTTCTAQLEGAIMTVDAVYSVNGSSGTIIMSNMDNDKHMMYEEKHE